MEPTEINPPETDASETNPPEATLSQEATSQPDNNPPRADLLLSEIVPSDDTRALEEEEEEQEQEQGSYNYEASFFESLLLEELGCSREDLYGDPQLDGLVSATISHDNPYGSPDTPDTKEGEDLIWADNLMDSAIESLTQQANIDAKNSFKQAIQQYKDCLAKEQRFSPRAKKCLEQMEKCLESLILICYQQDRGDEVNKYQYEMTVVKSAIQGETISGILTAEDTNKGDININDLPLSETTPQPNPYLFFHQESASTTPQPTNDEGDTASNRNTPSAS
jgi:hypothetical protein